MTIRNEDQDGPVASRRAVLLGAGALGAASILAGCGGEEPAPAPPGGPVSTTEPGPAPTTADAPPAGVIQTAQIPVGGGKIFAAQNVVVTQPTSGTFKAFSARCTHRGCQVAEVAGDTITCPCHGSQYSTVTGSVKRGPAVRGLAAKTVTVSGDTLTVS